MTPLVYNYQVGNPNATYPPSLTVKSSDAGVSVLNLAPTHKYVAFGLTSTPPLPPSPGYLQWTPTNQGIPFWVPLVFTGSNFMVGYTQEQFQAVDPTTVSYIYFSPNPSPIPGALPSLITSVSNFVSYTNLTGITFQYELLSDIDLENVTLVTNPTLPQDPVVVVSVSPSLTAVNNLPNGAVTYSFYGNNFPQSSTDNILIELDNKGGINGDLDIGGAWSDGPSLAGESARVNLVSKGWSVNVNEPLGDLNTSDNVFDTIQMFIHNGNPYYNKSVDFFNTITSSNKEGVTFLAFDNFIGNDVLFIISLYAYKNLTGLYIYQRTAITNLDLTASSSLTGITITACTNLTTIYTTNYYKNLIYVNFEQNALDNTTVNNILVAVDNNNKTNGDIFLNGGTNAAPTGTGITAKNNLLAKGWTVLTN